MDRVLGDVDVLLKAISLGPAPLLSADTTPVVWPLQASTFNVSGHPAVSVPTGLDATACRSPCRFAGRRFEEATILRAARVIELATGWESVPTPTLAAGDAGLGRRACLLGFEVAPHECNAKAPCARPS